MSALVADILHEIASGRPRHTNRANAIARAFDAIPSFRASDRLTREQLNDRAFMRDLERGDRPVDPGTSAR